jgi:predicted RNase H-like nuclease
MAFTVEAIRGVPPTVAGTIDYRLARIAVVKEYRRRRLTRNDVCDAHPELLRAARSAGQPTAIDCPICEETQVVLVSYVFGPGLPRSGRCVTSVREMDRLDRRRADLACYVVEVCPNCAWNHLARVFPVGAGAASNGNGTR